MGTKYNRNKDIRNGIFKHVYISNPTVTAADAVIAAEQNMADALKKKRTATSTTNTPRPSPTYKNFAHSAANKKATKYPAQHTSTTKMTHLPAPALNPAPEKLSVELPIITRPLRDTAPPPRVATLIYLSPPTPSSTTYKDVLMGIDIPRVNPSQRPPNVPTDQTAAPLVPKAAPPRRSPCIAALNIQLQDIRKPETAEPNGVEANG